MNPQKPPRIKDIAARLRLAPVSVSVALRGMPGVSEATRKKVQACAKQLGYRPDPAMSALAEYRRRTRPVSSFSQLAFITDYPENNAKEWGYTNDILAGAQKRGLEYGYEVVPFWLREGGCTRRQASSILFNRGIKGLLIAPMPVEEACLDLTWKYFCSVAIGSSLMSPQLDYATFDYHQAVQAVVAELVRRGYRRLGFVLLQSRSTRFRHLPLDAFNGHQLRHPELPALPPFSPTEFCEADFWQWFDGHRPEVIITDATDLFPAVLHRRRGLRIPEDVGVACFCRFASGRHDTTVSGVVQDLSAIGAAAVDRLHTNLLRNAYGLPDHSHGILTHGQWFEGTTLLKRHPGSGL